VGISNVALEREVGITSQGVLLPKFQ